MLEHNFNISKSDINKLMKKNTNKRVVADLKKSMDNINSVLNKIPLMFVTSKIEDLKNELLEKIESEKEKIIEDSQNIVEIEKELITFLNRLVKKVKNASINSPYKMYAYGMTSGHISFVPNYYNSDIVDLYLYNKAEYFCTMQIEKNKEVIKVKKITFVDKELKGLGDVVDRNKEHFVEAIKSLDIEMIFKLNSVLSRLIKQNKNSNNNFISDFSTYSGCKEYIEEQKLVNEINEFKDYLQLNKDIKINF